MIRCYYHGCDLDGFCSGAIVKYKYPEAKLYPINYGDVFSWDEIQREDTVFMVDFSLAPDAMENIDQKARLFIWIDHHSSAIKSYKESMITLPGSRDTSKAACELTWEYLFPDIEVPLLVKLLSLYDSWTYKGHELEDQVLPIQMRLRMENLNPISDEAMWNWEGLFESNQLKKQVDGKDVWGKTRYTLLNEGRLLLEYDQRNKDSYIKTYGFETELVCNDLYLPFTTKTPIYKAIAVNLGHTNSKVFDSVWNEDKYDLMITFVRRSDQSWNVSLYSTKPDIDCGAIAKTFGGGGHAGAGGFKSFDLPFYC